MESLLCLLLMEETPKDIYLMAKFLGAGLERTHANQTGTGIYYLDIDKIDEQWANDLPNTDIAIVSASAFKHINGCHNCKDNLVTILRTFSPTYFENGTCNTGGACKRTIPLKVNEINQKSSDMEIRTTQIEQLEEIKRDSLKKKSLRFWM
ncbi:hypothetical protein AXX17_AT5G37820 [Arabidopsis thaliana]|uniref:Trichome birefringence-like C-terminal domain-containing protein n=1 Tax=Arabidopsis thaliana TaxID=3702 RepID=A0A178UBG2_ARATH|nr:hypothetical protein AXX17_AT5G37820 [Arabidopsis thaliana]